MTIRSRSAVQVFTAVAFLSALFAPLAGAAVGRNATTKSYSFTLSIGMSEQMWTPAQVKAKHPKTGEVMLKGTMSGMGGMSMGGSLRHLEVHIKSLATGAVVAGAYPTITALDITAKDAMPVTVPYSEMEGVTEGAADLHYGNNVDLVGGHTYKVTVTLHGESAVLEAVAPK